MAQPILSAKALHKTYRPTRRNEVTVLRGADLDVQRGESVALMGPSGSGKSTLLNLLGLLDRPDSGELWLDAEQVASLTARQAARVRAHKVGFVFQQFNLLSDLNARENVALPAEYAGIPRRRALSIADDLLDQVGLAERRTHRPAELSGGEQQRVTIARALVNSPAIVLGDEPTGDLDSHTSSQIMDLLEALHHERSQTLLIVTHDPNVADRCDRTIRMLDGRILPET